MFFTWTYVLKVECKTQGHFTGIRACRIIRVEGEACVGFQLQRESENHLFFWSAGAISRNKSTLLEPIHLPPNLSRYGDDHEDDRSDDHEDIHEDDHCDDHEDIHEDDHSNYHEDINEDDHSDYDEDIHEDDHSDYHEDIHRGRPQRRSRGRRQWQEACTCTKLDRLLSERKDRS